MSGRVIFSRTVPSFQNSNALFDISSPPVLLILKIFIENNLNATNYRENET